MYKRVLVALSPLLFLCTAQAEDCGSARDQLTMNECYGKLYKSADAELNVLYKQINGRLKDDPDTKKLLVSAQRAWVAYRDAECGLSASTVTGGSIYPTIYANCLSIMTTERVKTFKRYLKCEEGDMSCPVPR